jgi:AraC-like DNA-binding protein
MSKKPDYAFKDDLIRNYINLIIHEALKLHPSENYHQHTNAASRITNVFLELLERQFPVESIDRPLQLKTAHDYAKNLNVHVNYLNRAVKEVTGKPTTTHITERVISEAKALCSILIGTLLTLLMLLVLNTRPTLTTSSNDLPELTQRHYGHKKFDILNYRFEYRYYLRYLVIYLCSII